MSNKNYAIVVAAGKGRRLGGKINKQYIEIYNKPIVAYTLEVFQRCEMIEGIVLVVGEKEIDFCKKEIVEKYGFTKIISVLAGGKERINSVHNGLKELPDQCEIVSIHDGARPFVTNEMINKSIIAAQEVGGAIVAVPVKDTIKAINSNMEVEKTIDRGKLWSVQTPQSFRFNQLKELYSKYLENGKDITDDAMLFEREGYPIKVIKGSYENIKITTPEDLFMAEEILRREDRNNA
ncbi:2-C-methyl-D-erythritol 4-phosphate cytidylyltransferase [Alkaliphilus pronyensis]|uniref:2-C-methyl-D-erythritol 4-phosphate cytidylyltransferase n=1 Tax=Alkaliphilus pronyensis TaxID=1482732 RepID=A0A6I0F3Q0_9FIRM|nr:2-C-methyl-D-erythritol 4-phosphate cytidylyltransferase [Alkaliphilus pronyensis]KAB3533599.1 2-C-methyl-D-erythritol 4-phosphate cytidylyltransferase [Alkaliphilus pronyensis]